MSSRYTLAIHTSSPDLGLAISDGGDIRQQVWPLGREQSNLMHHHLQAFLQPQTWAELSALAVAIGPGGFTGTRIGVVLARTLAQQLQIPLFGVSSLAAIAQQEADRLSHRSLPSELSFEQIAVQMPAQRGQLFTGIYQVSDQFTVMQSDAVMTEAVWQETLATLEKPYHLVKAESNQGDYVTGVLELAHRARTAGHQPNWSDVLPFYGQHPIE
ncbi:MAG: tRNA (adenosine(37)-N6)-threonylcarbamoyltransferase complex dimerization subunit type 1 TsaB [Myxacorys chilensis ATA2-1-KO14]|jgi:tRNA threonylcarbamoyl adenosine modification protein YeaZ|nr:tRNA (adenosine(37)-N6)-threonylcarbamoyltransferase complex dimerization subunit type 1 TsaB [Myxacorys chilensis ATA2-1-KO14]